MLDKSCIHKNQVSFWLCISLILNGYASGVPGVSLGSVCFIIFVILALMANKWRFNNIVALTTTSIIAFAFISLIDFCFVPYETPIQLFLLAYSKILIWWAFICFVSQTYYDFELLTKWVVRIGVVLNVYLIIQNVAFYGLGIYLPNIFSFGPLVPYDEGYANYAVLGASQIIRPASLLSESSFLGNYLMLALALILKRIRTSQHKNDAKLCLFFTLGIFLTSSTSAIFLTVVIWLFLGYNLIRRYKFVTILLSLFVSLYLFTHNVSLDDFNNSSATGQAVFRTFDKLNYIDSNVRFGASYRMLDYLSPEQKALGVGLGNEQNFIQPYINSDYMYLNSITQFIINVGYTGLFFLIILFSYMVFLSLKYRDRVALSLILIYIIKVFGSGFLFNTYGTLYMFVIVGSLYSHKKHYKYINGKVPLVRSYSDQKQV